MVVLKPICVNGSNCQGSSTLPPCVGSCGGGGGSGGGSFPEWNINDSYLVDTVVINDGVLYIANSDIPPGTPFEVGDIPGTWRPLEAGTASIPPFNPESSYAQYRAVLYEGRIYVANAALIPGPFNPANWTEVLVTGAVSTQDTVTVDLSGNGTAGDPVTAAVNIDPSDDNLLEVTENGLMVDRRLIPGGGSDVIISQGVTMNVDVVTGDDTDGDGSLSHPFATLDAAIAAASNGDVVTVWPGVYVPPTGLKSNITLQAVNDRVTLNGPVALAGVQNLRMIGFTVNGKLTFNNCTGNVVLERLTLGNNDVEFTGQNTGTFVLNNLSIDGTLRATDAAQGNAAVTVLMLGDATGSPSVTVDVINGRFYVGNRQNIGNVLHRRGLLVIEDVVRVLNLDHSADAASSNLLYVKNASNFNPQTGVYATVTKTGNAAFVFNNFARDASTDESGFAGTKTLIEQARDIHGNYSPTNYSVERPDVAAHLKGLDEALANVGDGKLINMAFSLVGGWDDAEILFVHTVAQGTYEFPPSFEGSIATSDVAFTGSVNLSLVPPEGGAAQTFGTIAFDNGTVTFSGGGNDAPPGSTIILTGSGSVDFGFLAITLAATFREQV